MMTDKEIMKALEVCSIFAVPQCERCPYYKQDDCVEKSANDAINLIKRQQEMIDSLIAGQETLISHISRKKKKIEKLENEVERLRKIAEKINVELEKTDTSVSLVDGHIENDFDSRAFWEDTN